MKDVTKINLYQITEEIEAFAELIMMDEGEISEAHESLERQVEHLLATKTENCISYLDREEDLIKLADEKIKALQDFKKKKKNGIERFKSYIANCLEKSGRESFESDLYKIKFRKPSKVVEIEDRDSLPVEFVEVVQEIKTKKAEIAKALKAGEVVSGAKLVDGKKSLIMGLK